MNKIVPLLAVLLSLLTAPLAALADEAAVRAIVPKFAAAEDFSQIEGLIDELAATGDPLAVATLRGLMDGTLNYLANSKRVVIVDGSALRDPVTGEDIGKADGQSLVKIKIKNSVRRKIGTALSILTLRAPDRNVRISAVETIFQTSDASQIDGLKAAIEAEPDAAVKRKMVEALASIMLAGPADEGAQLDAIAVLKARADRAAASILAKFEAGASGAPKEEASRAIVAINGKMALWDSGKNVWYGVSLGSVLFLAAIGLAITFGVMGVINMAHGEMVMLGAYSTFVVQGVIARSAPGLQEYSLAIAVPVAFLVAGFAGFVMERGIIRFLYGRPLETLLATFGVSLILQQAVRTAFGPTNQEVSSPQWMSGSILVGQLDITWNRLWIVLFSLAVFAVLLVVLNRTSLGLQMRAVTQNRRMAAAMGIRTPWVDAMTFALGSGIAGIAGVALSQIDNVSPNLGQGYIIDSFMVVVFGGVGNLWGTLIGALSLGIANKFLEPYAGAVLGKILVLVFIILFIQRRPRGLFALKGRAAET